LTPYSAPVQPDNIYVDVTSGAKASRPQFDLVMKLLREGDTLKVTRLDRLGRSVLHLITLGAELRERRVGPRVIEQGIDIQVVGMLPITTLDLVTLRSQTFRCFGAYVTREYATLPVSTPVS
jgi:hypothetical protein